MNIGIIGQGFVGNAIYQRFKNYYEEDINNDDNKIYNEINMQHHD